MSDFGDGGLSIGAKVGISVGVILALGAIAVVLYFFVFAEDAEGNRNVITRTTPTTRPSVPPTLDGSAFVTDSARFIQLSKASGQKELDRQLIQDHIDAVKAEFRFPLTGLTTTLQISSNMHVRRLLFANLTDFYDSDYFINDEDREYDNPPDIISYPFQMELTQIHRGVRFAVPLELTDFDLREVPVRSGSIRGQDPYFGEPWSIRWLQNVVVTPENLHCVSGDKLELRIFSNQPSNREFFTKWNYSYQPISTVLPNYLGGDFVTDLDGVRSQLFSLDVQLENTGQSLYQLDRPVLEVNPIRPSLTELTTGASSFKLSYDIERSHVYWTAHQTNNHMMVGSSDPIHRLFTPTTFDYIPFDSGVQFYVFTSHGAYSMLSVLTSDYQVTHTHFKNGAFMSNPHVYQTSMTSDRPTHIATSITNGVTTLSTITGYQVIRSFMRNNTDDGVFRFYEGLLDQLVPSVNQDIFTSFSIADMMQSPTDSLECLYLVRPPADSSVRPYYALRNQPLMYEDSLESLYPQWS